MNRAQFQKCRSQEVQHFKLRYRSGGSFQNPIGFLVMSSINYWSRITLSKASPMQPQLHVRWCGK
jgi:hypothetical protein